MDRHRVEGILNLIAAAETYGYYDDILMGWLARDILKGNLTEEDIEHHCRWYLSEEAIEDGYTEEDYEDVKETLIFFKNKYINNIIN